jgi:hypothetical protein
MLCSFNKILYVGENESCRLFVKFCDHCIPCIHDILQYASAAPPSRAAYLKPGTGLQKAVKLASQFLACLNRPPMLLLTSLQPSQLLGEHDQADFL